MKKMTLTSAAIMSALTVAAPAAQAAEANWSGLYGGLSIGYQDAQLHGTIGGLLDYYGVSNPKTGTPAFGGALGYNYQMPQSPVVFGVEATLDFGMGEGRTGPTTPFGHATTHTSVPYVAGLRAKIGYAVGQALPYIQTGPVLADTRYKVTAPDGLNDGGSKVSAGWDAGIGVDYALQPNVIVRASYTYTWLPSEKYFTTSYENKYHINLNTFKVGYAYKF